MIFRHFVQSFQSPWVKAYFDIGNHVRFAPPEEWTDARRSAREDPRQGLQAQSGRSRRPGRVGEYPGGDVRWPVLRQALEVVNYNGWMTIESNGSIPMEERNKRLDLILAGQ